MQKKQGMDFGYGLKSTIAQCIVLTTTYFLNAQQGINITMPMTIIGAFKSLKSKESFDTQIDITNEQLSWIGSLVYLSPPLGSLFLSLVLARLGHRVCMLLTNIVQFSAILIVVLFPVTVNTLYMCSILMGLSTGCATGLCISYSGEVCEPKLRGSLTSALNVFYFAGNFFVSTAYAITESWKKSLISSIVFPLINVVALSLTPDSPMWLLSRGKPEKAKKVLKKIRGCVSEEKCALEFQEMVQYVSKSTKSEEAKLESSFWDRFLHPGLWKPLQLATIYLFFSNVLSGVPYSQYLLEVTETIKDDTPISAEWAVSVYTACSVAGNIFTILLVNFLGKRCLLLSTIGMCSLSFMLIGVIGLFFGASYYTSWAKLILFFLTMICSSMGIMPIGWILISEIFPMKSKNLGCNICSAVYFLLSFAMTKCYEDFEAFVGFYNMFVWFGITGFVSLVYFYFCVPETENKTLKEIADQFKLESA